MKIKLKYYKILIISGLFFMHFSYSQTVVNHTDQNKIKNLIYLAKDSILYDLDNNQVFLYNKAEVIFKNPGDDYTKNLISSVI